MDTERTEQVEKLRALLQVATPAEQDMAFFLMYALAAVESGTATPEQAEHVRRVRADADDYAEWLKTQPSPQLPPLEADA